MFLEAPTTVRTGLACGRQDVYRRNPPGHTVDTGMEARDDDNVFSDFVSACSSSSSAVNEDRVHNKLPQSVREFLKKKFGTIARFYSGISVADTTDVNGFSRIKELRRALSALDRGGWERSYHQKLFHVSLFSLGGVLECSGLRGHP